MYLEGYISICVCVQLNRWLQCLPIVILFNLRYCVTQPSCGVKYMWKYSSKVQVLWHLLKYKYKYMALFWEKYLSKMQVLLEVFKYKYKYHTRENFDRKKFWRTIQVRGIGEKKLVNKLQWVHMPNKFSVYLWIMARKILANSSGFSKFANFSPTKISVCSTHLQSSYDLTTDYPWSVHDCIMWFWLHLINISCANLPISKVTSFESK